MRKLLLLSTLIIGVTLFTGCFDREVENEGTEPKTQTEITDDIKETDTNNGQNQEVEDEDMKTEKGQFTGAIDLNSIEVKMIESDEEEFKVFRFSEEIIDRIASYELQEGDLIILKYKVDENNSNIIYDIEKYNSENEL